MKRLFKPLICVITLSALMLTCSLAVLASGECEHNSFHYEQASDDITHSKICDDCGNVIASGMRCYGGSSGCGYRAKCEGCGEEYGSMPLGHIWRVYDLGGKLSSNELVHYDACATCGIAREGTEEQHSYGIWRVTLSPTEEASGQRSRLCEICGYAQIEAIPQLERSNNVGLIIFLIIIALLVAGAGAFILVWLLYYKRTMRDLAECAVALGTDLKNIAVNVIDAICDFFSIIGKSVLLFFTKVRAFFCRIGRAIKGFFQTVAIIFKRCVRAVRDFFIGIKEFFVGLGR